MNDCLPPVGAYVYVGSARYRAVVVSHDGPEGYLKIRFGDAAHAVGAPAKLCVLADPLHYHSAEAALPPNQPGPARGVANVQP